MKFLKTRKKVLSLFLASLLIVVFVSNVTAISKHTVSATSLFARIVGEDLSAADGTAEGVEVTDFSNVLIYTIAYSNFSGADAYLQIFDADADDVTVGTTEADFVIVLSDNEALSIPFETPIQFTTGLTIASTTTATGNAPATSSTVMGFAAGN